MERERANLGLCQIHSEWPKLGKFIKYNDF